MLLSLILYYIKPRLLFQTSYPDSDSDLPLYITLEQMSVSLKPDLILNTESYSVLHCPPLCVFPCKVPLNHSAV